MSLAKNRLIAISNKNKTYHIITIGCQMNIADSERLAAFLEERGYIYVPTTGQAAIIAINTCGIRQTAEDRAYGLVNTIRKNNPLAKIIVTGCLSKRADVQKRLRDRADIFLPINEMLQLPEILDGEEIKPRFSLDAIRLKQGEEYLNILPKRGKSFTATVPIGNGCNNFCSYCVVPYARGREVYRSAPDIIKEVKKLIKAGYKEIVLLAQNVNSYKDKKYNFPKLLAQIASLPGDFWIRFSSSHPKDVSSELIKVIGSSPKICSHLHLAVQSGDDEILRAMNRKYTVKHFKALIKKMRKTKPGIAITTDVIVGFPGETRKQFANTVKLFRDIKFDLAYISQYSPRPGTVSAQMKDNVTREEKKRRDEVIDKVLKKTALTNNKKYLKKEISVLVEGINKRGKYYGKTSTYQTVLIRTANPANSKLVGNFVKVRITEILPFALEGDLIN